jgi:hypothetical protein
MFVCFHPGRKFHYRARKFLAVECQPDFSFFQTRQAPRFGPWAARAWPPSWSPPSTAARPRDPEPLPWRPWRRRDRRYPRRWGSACTSCLFRGRFYETLFRPESFATNSNIVKMDKIQLFTNIYLTRMDKIIGFSCIKNIWERMFTDLWLTFFKYFSVNSGRNCFI